jgi:hypothetical protein
MVDDDPPQPTVTRQAPIPKQHAQKRTKPIRQSSSPPVSSQKSADSAQKGNLTGRRKAAGRPAARRG